MVFMFGDVFGLSGCCFATTRHACPFIVGASPVSQELIWKPPGVTQPVLAASVAGFLISLTGTMPVM